MAWDPSQYLKYADHRLRPGAELLARVPLPHAESIVDLGCGTGELTCMLADRWPNARVIGVDSSAEMLSEASAKASRGCAARPPNWVEQSIEDWVARPDQDASVDLIYSNAALHWVSDHATILPQLVDRLRPGGCLAVQMPLSWHAPSHRFMREVLSAGGPGGSPIGQASLAASLAEPPVMEASAYYGLFADIASSIDIWSTEYQQVLSQAEHGQESAEHPVLEWVRATGLRPVLDGLSDHERQVFLEAYGGRLSEAYPVTPDGRCLYAFPRVFMVVAR
ncbi:MAG: methyltransferase domain-containing protein [Planctomycetota bacterium]